MKRYAFLLLILLMSTLAFADDNPPRVVKVVGTSDVKVVPDRAVIEIGVEKQNISAAYAKKSADAASREVLTALSQNGVDEKDIQTAYLSLQPQYDWKSGRVTYFVAEQSLTVTVRDLSKLDTLLEALVKAGGNRIGSVRYETSESRKYRDQAREMAVKAAREKAEDLAKALGQSIGKAYSIEEVPQSSSPYSFYAYAANSSVETASPTRSAPTTAPGQLKMTASVTVWFELQ